jgi:hypothetical protein
VAGFASLTEEHSQTTAELAAALAAVTASDPEKPSSFTIFPGNEFDLQSVGFVSQEQALDTLVDPDHFVAFEHQSSPRMFLAAKAENTANGASVLLALAYDVQGQLELSAGYRLYGSEREAASFATDAGAAFQTLLQRYALPFRSGKGTALFVPVLKVKGTDTHIEWDLGLPSGGWLLNGYTGVLEDESGATAIVAWLFILDVARYRADVQAHQR